MALKDRKQIYSFSLSREAVKAIRYLAKSYKSNRSLIVSEAVLDWYKDAVKNYGVKVKP